MRTGVADHCLTTWLLRPNKYHYTSSFHHRQAKYNFLLFNHKLFKSTLGVDVTLKQMYNLYNIAGWSSLVARRAHNPKVVGSNPSPATQGFSFYEKSFFISLFHYFTISFQSDFIKAEPISTKYRSSKNSLAALIYHKCRQRVFICTIYIQYIQFLTIIILRSYTFIISFIPYIWSILIHTSIKRAASPLPVNRCRDKTG